MFCKYWYGLPGVHLPFTLKYESVAPGHGRKFAQPKAKSSSRSKSQMLDQSFAGIFKNMTKPVKHSHVCPRCFQRCSDYHFVLVIVLLTKYENPYSQIGDNTSLILFFCQAGIDLCVVMVRGYPGPTIHEPPYYHHYHQYGYY